MMPKRTLAALVALAALAACGSRDGASAEQRAAGDAAAPGTPGTTEGDFAATEGDVAGTDLDGPVNGAPRPLQPGESFEYQPTGRYRPPTVHERTIEITLRSTPPGAIAAVDGKIVGPTPTFWRGKMTGKPREFTFVLADYSMARYRFVPTSNGVVHATLQPLVVDEPDAGAAR